jgi:4-hydroxy-tetrahydrodipicolinate synthase
LKSEQTICGGVIAAAVTPRRAHEHSIDLAASLESIDFLCERGVDGIALLGSTGEFVHFVLEDRARMLDFVVKRSRAPVLANVSHSTLDGALWLGQEALESGVAGLLLAPPYYFRYSQDALRRFYLEFAESVGARARVYLYNIPQFTNGIAIETAQALLETGLFAGIKDSSGDWDYFTRLLETRNGTPFTLFIGSDALLARARPAGADGIVSGVAAALPELMMKLDRALSGRHTAAAQKLDARLQEFLAWLADLPAPVVIKEAAKQRKIKAGAPAIPLSQTEAQRLEQFRAWFREWLPVILKECK